MGFDPGVPLRHAHPLAELERVDVAVTVLVHLVHHVLQLVVVQHHAQLQHRTTKLFRLKTTRLILVEAMEQPKHPDLPLLGLDQDLVEHLPSHGLMPLQ